MSDELLALAAICETVVVPDREVDARIAIATGARSIYAMLNPAIDPDLSCVWVGSCGYALPFYTRATEAALTLVPEGRFVGALSQCEPDGEWYARIECFDAVFQDATATSAALALTAAALRAKATTFIAIKEGGES